MPKAYPKEFREDVIRVARNREDGTTVRQIATDFGISESCLTNWLMKADVEEGNRPGVSSSELSELGDISLCLYDVTTLYFEAENEDDLRKVGYSKERRVDPQVVVGLLVDRAGFPLEIGCFEGNTAETTTLIPIIEGFQARHGLTDFVIVADAGMLSASNLKALDEAGLKFIVGSRVTKAPTEGVKLGLTPFRGHRLGGC